MKKDMLQILRTKENIHSHTPLPLTLSCPLKCIWSLQKAWSIEPLFEEKFRRLKQSPHQYSLLEKLAAKWPATYAGNNRLEPFVWWAPFIMIFLWWAQNTFLSVYNIFKCVCGLSPVGLIWVDAKLRWHLKSWRRVKGLWTQDEFECSPWILKSGAVIKFSFDAIHCCYRDCFNYLPQFLINQV